VPAISADTVALPRIATVDPFVHMDQMGEIDYAPGEPKGTPSAGSRPSPT